MSTNDVEKGYQPFDELKGAPTGNPPPIDAALPKNESEATIHPQDRQGVTVVTKHNLKEALTMYEIAFKLASQRSPDVCPANGTGYYPTHEIALRMMDHASRMMAAEAEDNQYARRNR